MRETIKDMAYNRKNASYFVHDYFAVDVEIMWLVINDDLPILKRQIEGYLSE